MIFFNENISTSRFRKLTIKPDAEHHDVEIRTHLKFKIGSPTTQQG